MANKLMQLAKKIGNLFVLLLASFIFYNIGVFLINEGRSALKNRHISEFYLRGTTETEQLQDLAATNHEKISFSPIDGSENITNLTSTTPTILKDITNNGTAVGKPSTTGESSVTENSLTTKQLTTKHLSTVDQHPTPLEPPKAGQLTTIGQKATEQLPPTGQLSTLTQRTTEHLPTTEQPPTTGNPQKTQKNITSERGAMASLSAPGNHEATKVFQELLHLLGPTNGTKDFQNKLFEYLKKKAKLASQVFIDWLSHYVHLIESAKDFVAHQYSERTDEVIVPFRIPYPSSSWKGRQLPLMVPLIIGGTGNIMGEYATAYALHRIYNVSVLLHPDMKNALSSYFPHLSINETITDEDRKEAEKIWQPIANEGGTFMYGNFELAAAGLFGPKIFALAGYGFEIQMFNLFYDDLKNDFKFADNIQKQADVFLNSVRGKAGNFSQTITYIGFHVRRTDYSNHMKVIFNASLPGDTYFELAMTYYRNKFDFPIFLVASDDTRFIREESIIGKQKDVYISEGKSTAEDMAILASCNHSIMTLGTYGFWGGYLAGGEVVYPVDSSQKNPYRLNDRLLEELNLKNFTPLKF